MIVMVLLGNLRNFYIDTKSSTSEKGGDWVTIANADTSLSGIKILWLKARSVA
jgi:hypothetical protein